MEQTEIVKSAVSRLIEDGKITQEEVATYFPESVDKIKFLADSLHTFLCFKMHTSDLEDLGKTDGCDYYLENQLAQEEDVPTMFDWRLKADNISTRLRLKTLDDMKGFHLRFTNFCKEVYLFMEAFPEGFCLLRKFMETYHPPQ